MDRITPLDRRYWRARQIPDEDCHISAVSAMDPDTGSRFTHAAFECDSQSDPEKRYKGIVSFNGQIEAISCDCPDCSSPPEELDYEPAYREGHRTCKHAEKALLLAGYPVAAEFRNAL